MPSGFEKNKQRKDTLNSFGKDLIRRGKSKCELCEADDVKLRVFELPPYENEPIIEQCLMICEKCSRQITKPKLMDPQHWRCLYNTIWSDINAIQVLTIYLLNLLSSQTDWAADLASQIDLDEDQAEWLQEIRTEINAK
ncbi:MAG: phnA protein [Candidatus Omnitrophica bacterium]|nr:phnA protein [Candidatus Omnitrophota bacterium]